MIAVGVREAVTQAHHEEWARVVASLTRRFGDLGIAEEAAAEAFATAVERWPADGVPPSPGAWLTTTASRKAVDRIRRETKRDDKHKEAELLHDDDPPESPGPIDDERLRLIFTCCHPALAMQARVALTLRMVAGLTVPEIARAFLVQETAIGQRITRAKAKIKAARIPYRVPSAQDLPARVSGVLAVLFLVFNEGYLATGPGTDPVRHDLTAEAIRLARLILALLPQDGEVAGLLAHRRHLLSSGRNRAMIGTVMAEPIRRTMAGSSIGATALADLLGRWPAAEGPLYRLLATRIARLADTGELSPGLRLPAERDLAAALSVSRNTVAAAYQLLRDEGMAESRQGAGTSIVPHRTTPAAVHRANGFFAGLLEVSQVSADLSIAAVDCAPQVATALVDPASVAGRDSLRDVIMSTGYFPHGVPVLREALAGHLTQRLGLLSGPNQVMVTTGSQQALDLLVRSEVLPGQPVAVEDPTFPGVLDTLHRSGARVIGVPADGGLDVDRLEHALRTHRPALVYLIPSHHNPTGLVMPPAHRRRIALLAAGYPDTLFVDDMTLAELSLRDAPLPPPLATYGSQPNIVTVGSLSKVYWGGLRTGWIRADPGLIGRLAAAKAAADLGSPALQQAVVAVLLDSHHDDILNWRSDWLRTRYDTLTSALQAQLPSWTWPSPEGGLTLWVRLPERADGGAFAQAAIRHGVAVVPGRLLSATAGASANAHIRLAFTQAPATLTDAVAALAKVSVT